MLAVQDTRDGEGMLPLCDLGTYFELVPSDELESAQPRRLPLAHAEPGVDYAVAVTTDAGIWAYVLGDLVRITGLQPLRLTFVGRTAHSLNAFGEHLAGEELERAVLGAAEVCATRVVEYAVGTVFPVAGRAIGGHVWFVEFEGPTPPTDRFETALDEILRAGNADYEAHRAGGFGLRRPRLQLVPRGGFYAWLEEQGRFGGQVKVPRVLDASQRRTLAARLASVGAGWPGAQDRASIT
jgi:hypothetical protein